MKEINTEGETGRHTERQTSGQRGYHVVYFYRGTRLRSNAGVVVDVGANSIETRPALPSVRPSVRLYVFLSVCLSSGVLPRATVERKPVRVLCYGY